MQEWISGNERYRLTPSQDFFQQTPFFIILLIITWYANIILEDLEMRIILISDYLMLTGAG